MCASGDIFQDNVHELIGDIKGVKTYIDDILISIKDIFEKHIDQQRILFGILHTVGLKVDTSKCSFGLKFILYLGYVITSEGIKPDPKKLQGIVDLGWPATTTEAQALLGMVQYYRDMWTRRSHILAPLVEAAIGHKGKKIVEWRI